MIGNTKGQEFRRGWRVLLASSFGAAVGIAGLFGYTPGLFANDLEVSIGLSRTQFGISYLLTSLGIAVSMPVVGWAVDRYGVRWPTVVGAVGLSLSFVALAIFTQSVTSYLILVTLLGIFGSASTSVGFTRAIASWFEKGRGFALGVIQAGVGVSAAVMPVVVSMVIGDFGWRAGFLALAGIAILGAASTMLFVRTREDNEPRIGTRAAADGFDAVRSSSLFWIQFAAFSCSMLVFTGMVVHFVPMLRSAGTPAMEAANYAALIGASVLLSRLIIGWLADVVHAPSLAAGACALGGLGCVLLASGQMQFAPLAAIFIGCAVGAEVDLLGYLTARYFGLKVYGRAYAWQYTGVICAAGAAPAWVGWVADKTGGYQAGQIICAIGAAGVAGLFLTLPRYRSEQAYA